jgi:hypothetical protein
MIVHTDEAGIAETVFERSDKKWHYWDVKSFQWVGPYDTEDEARRAQYSMERAA